MSRVLTVTGRDVLFAHWPFDPDALDPVVPDSLAVDTFDGTAWVSVLALENRSVAPGSLSLPPALERGVPQLNLRTYVSLDGDPGVFFLSLDTGRRAPALTGRRAFGLPFHRARMRMTRCGDRLTFRSRRDGDDTPAAVFQARYRPTGDQSPADPGSLADFCVEHYRYYLPAARARYAAPVGPPGAGDEDVYVGTIERDAWELGPVTATVRRNTLFEAAGLPTPDAEPVVQYSPGFEMGVQPVEVREASDAALPEREG